MVAANRRLNHALAVFGRREHQKPPVAHVCRIQRTRRLGTSRVTCARAAGEALGKKAAPVDAAIIGIIDDVDFEDDRK